MKVIAISISEQQNEKILKHMKETGMHKSEFIRRLLDNYFEDKYKDNKKE